MRSSTSAHLVMNVLRSDLAVATSPAFSAGVASRIVLVRRIRRAATSSKSGLMGLPSVTILMTSSYLARSASAAGTISAAFGGVASSSVVTLAWSTVSIWVYVSDERKLT